MPKSVQRYWDSDCFLGWFNAESDKVSRCKGTVEKAHHGKVELVVSAITLVEVIRLKGKPRLKESSEQKIKEFFENDFILLVNVDKFIAESARKLIWDKNLKPKDSIHVATALYKKISILNTFDNDLLKLDGQLELNDRSDKLKICEPDIQVTGNLFDKHDEEKEE